jgi:branched-subunit amino acid ABC-type transport system permease component
MVDLAAPTMLALLAAPAYALAALGLTMTYSITKVPNFAHAEYVTVGGYVAVAMVNFLGGGLVESVVAGFLAAAIVSMVSDELVFKPLTRRGATPLHLLVASIGLGLVIRYVLSIVVASYGLLLVRSSISKRILVFNGEPLTFFGAPVTNLHAWILPTTFGLVIALHVLFTRTRLGKGMRAMASNYDLARVSGIRTADVRRWTWFLAGGLAGTGGAFWAVDVQVHPETGWGLLLWMFAASILGGFVSFWGTIAGGFVVGFAENVGISMANDLFGVPLSYRPLIALAIIVIVFLIRPQGITGLTTPAFRAIATRWIARMRAVFGRG